MSSQLSAGTSAGLRNVEQAAEYLNVSQKYIWRVKDSGALPHVRLGRRVLFTESDLVAYIERSRVAS